jgi:Flp pilus assembly protein TadB
MNGVLAINSLLQVLTDVLLIAEVLAFIDCLTHKPAAYVAAGKQTKQFWTILLSVCFIITLFFGLLGSFISLVSVIAVIVYFVDVRPALRSLRGGRNDRHMGPYGPW